MAESNSLIQTLNLVVIGRQGLITSKHYADAKFKSSYNFTFEITQEMMPEATAIVFYVRDQDGEVIFDQFNIELGFKSNNKVSSRKSTTKE
jgi:uncharacterized protein with ATP-grasp and redox domains